MKSAILYDELTKLREQYKSKIESYSLVQRPDGKSYRDIPANDVEGLRTLQADIDAKAAEWEAQREIDEFGKKNDDFLSESKKGVNNVPVAGKAVEKQYKRLSDELMDRKDILTDIKMPRGIEIDAKGLLLDIMERKTLMTTSANGYPPEVLRDGTVVPYAARPPQLLDYLIVEPTNQNAIKYMSQTVRTNAAVEKSEGAAAGEAVLTWAEVTDIISKIPVFIPVTDEELEDEPGLRSLIDNDLIMMVRQRLDQQVCVGDGSDPNLLGIFNGAAVQTQAKSTDPTFDACMKAMTKVNLIYGCNANLFAFHSNDWQEIALTRTADGIYLLGNPSDAVPKRLWGLNVVMNEALTEGNGLCMDTFQFRVKMRKGVTIQVTDSHEDYFTKGIQVIKATCRAGLKRIREAGACKITGI